VDTVDADSAQVFACPAHVPSVSLPYVNKPYIGESYGYGSFFRSAFSDKLDGSTNWTSYPSIWPREPSRRILLIDSIRQSASVPEIAFVQQSYVTASDSTLAVACRHNKKCNVLFYDGHVEALGKKQLCASDGAGNAEYGNVYASYYPQFVYEMEE
jgi:prepilin-type processing-associated H-X9-DG protein